MKRHLYLTFLVCLTVLSLIGCGGDKQPATDKQTAAKPANMASTKAEPAEKLKFKTANDTEALYIKRYSDHEKLEIDFEGTKSTLKARKNEGDRVKYKESVGDQDKELVAKIKYKDDSIKLVDDSEKLLFKVKIKEDKIKIADNEEMTAPYELKSKSAEKIEIRDQSGNEIGNVKFYPDTGKLKVKDAENKEILILKNYKSSAAPGVILFEKIPVKLRCIIINELLKKGR